MARCGCAADRCDCHFVAGDNVIITGSGTRSNPYVVESVATVVEGGGGGGGTTDSTTGRFPGEIVPYAADSPPAGWLVCDGSVISRTIYSDLFGVIGTRFGTGDGTSTFAIPDLRGRFPLGANDSYPLSVKGGSSGKTLGIANIPSHTHSLAAHSHTMNHAHPQATATGGGHDHHKSWREDANSFGPQDNVAAAGGTGGRVVHKEITFLDGGVHNHPVDIPTHYGSTGSSGTQTTGAVGNGESFDVMNPYLAVNYLIKT